MIRRSSGTPLGFGPLGAAAPKPQTQASGLPSLVFASRAFAQDANTTEGSPINRRHLQHALRVVVVLGVGFVLPGVALLREPRFGGAGDILNQPLDVLRVRRRLTEVNGIFFTEIKRSIYVDDVEMKVEVC